MTGRRTGFSSYDCTMPGRDISQWLQDFFPAITASGGWGGDPCWIAWAKTQDAEHNPPFFWLGLALDTVEEAGLSDWFRERVRAAHGPGSCRGQHGSDGRAQDVLTEVCAFTWALNRLGEPRIEPLSEGPPELVAIRLYVPEHETYIKPRRLRPQTRMDLVIEDVAAAAEEAAQALPSEAGRILYADIWHERWYHENVGYRLDLTEPVHAAVRHFASDHRLGHVLTRPYEWGRPIEASY